MTKKVLIAIIAVLGISTAYSAGKSDTTPVDVAYATPSATIVATPEPTPLPTLASTPDPTAAPTQAPVTSDAWLEFAIWGATSIAECDISTLQQAINTWDDVTAYAESIGLQLCFERNKGWLDAHQPEDCYRSIWSEAHHYFDNAAGFARKSAAFWYDYPYANTSDLEQSLTFLERATTNVGNLSDMLTDANNTSGFCSSASNTVS